jgi:signal transduction histidine kinase
VDQSTLRITDNGAGFLAAARAKGGLGLRIMEYRAEMIGATFRIGSSNASGTSHRSGEGWSASFSCESSKGSANPRDFFSSPKK